MKTKLMGMSSTLVLGLSLLSAPALAQTAAPPDAPAPTETAVVGDIIVTAQRRSETLQRVPASVEVLTGEALRAARVSNLGSLQEVSPSLVVTQTNNPNAAVFTVRGVGTAVTDRGFEQSVGVYIDGVFRGRPGAALQDLLDIERVEILRGPQSTLFGRNNSAGAINISTTVPDTNEFGAYAEATYGAYNTVEARLSANLPLIEDRLALRLSLGSASRDGFNTAPNLPKGDVNAQDRQSARAQLYWTPTDQTRVRLIADYSDADNRCCAPGLLFMADAAVNAPFAFLARGNMIGFTPPSAGTIGPSPSNPANPGTIYNPFDRITYQDTQARDTTTDKGLSVQVDQDFGSLTLTAIGATRRFSSALQADLDGVNSAMISAVSRPETDIRENSAELRLQNNDGGPLQYVVGAYVFDQKIIDDNNVSILIRPTKGTFNYYNSHGIGTAESVAVFGQASYDLTETLKVTGGLRYLDETKKAVLTTNGGLSFPGTAEISGDAVMGTAVLAYQPTPMTNFYLRYARGYKSAAINLLFTAPPALVSPIAEPETTDAYELGAKLRLFDGRVSTNVALYTQTVQDQQVQIFDASTNAFITLNAAEVRSRGVEADVRYRATSDVTLNLSASYLDAEYMSFNGAPPPAGSALTSQDLSGRTPAKAPRWTLVGGVNLDRDLAGGMRLLGNVSLRHASSQYNDLPLTEAFRNGAVNLVSASAELVLDNGVGIQVWGRNLTDENYYTSGNALPVSNGSLAAYVNDPRTYGVTVRYRY